MPNNHIPTVHGRPAGASVEAHISAFIAGRRAGSATFDALPAIEQRRQAIVHLRSIGKFTAAEAAEAEKTSGVELKAARDFVAKLAKELESDNPPKSTLECVSKLADLMNNAATLRSRW